jgi:SAM-dependent methyltransferase
MPHAGHLDRVDGRTLHGWAYDTEKQASPTLVASLAGAPIAEFRGDEFRADLVLAGIGDGHHAFTWAVPPDIDAGLLPLLAIRFAETGQHLAGSERIFSAVVLGSSEPFLGFLSRGLWAIDHIGTVDHGAEIGGWAVPPYGSPLPFLITQNGSPMEVIERASRPDVAERLRLLGNDSRFGFTARSTQPFDASAAHEFAFCDARSGKPFNRHQSIHLLPVSGPAPNPERRKRVGGSEDIDIYRQVGATAYTRLDRVAAEYFGKPLGEADAVLDWGCGSGRVFQFLPPERRSRYTGIDIDADNIGWCREAFPESRFETVALQPPTTLASGSFDCVFAISVLSHLTEHRQFEWLAEIHRLTRPGAAVLLSVNGEIAWATCGLSLQRYAEWRSTGFAVVGQNFDLDGSPADASEYVNTFISRRYIFDHWSRYFNVVDVLPGVIGNQQDLVILQRA